MANILKKAASNLIDKMSARARVLDIRAWHSNSMYEIDLHLPAIDLSKWKAIQRLKCSVGEFEWRDYTPAKWDVEKRTCTLYIEAAHNGVGSRWVKNLQKDDVVSFGAAYAAKLPTSTGKILCLGDGSALGHFLALKQLTNRNEYPLEAAVFLHEEYNTLDNFYAENPEFEFQIGTNSMKVLEQCINTKSLKEYSSICIAGYIPMVTTLLKKIKNISGVQAKIYAVGFWS